MWYTVSEDRIFEERMDYKKIIASNLAVTGLSEEELYNMLALPPDTEMGDYALPCFRLAKTLRKAPALIAEELAANYPCGGGIVSAQAVNGYVNFKVDRKDLAACTLERILAERERYGSSEEGRGKTVCID